MPLAFPAIDPIAIQLGPLAIRWYSLAYIAGIGIGWWIVKFFHKRDPVGDMPENAIDDMIVWAVVGIILGGRLGYVLFYKPGYYLTHPHEILMLWEGGMSFHGGFLGVLLAFFLFARKYKLRYLRLMDVIAVCAPIGLFFGRIANFINGELFGRVTDSAVGMVFPHGGPLPRHPSQLYEAALEGLVLFVVLFALARFTHIRKREGALAGVFLIGYGVARSIVETFREPDAFIGFLFEHVTMGQLLCAPMIALGAYLLIKAKPRETA